MQKQGGVYFRDDSAPQHPVLLQTVRDLSGSSTLGAVSGAGTSGTPGSSKRARIEREGLTGPSGGNEPLYEIIPYRQGRKPKLLVLFPIMKLFGTSIVVGATGESVEVTFTSKLDASALEGQLPRR
jgi:hypothetical protein